MTRLKRGRRPHKPAWTRKYVGKKHRRHTNGPWPVSQRGCGERKLSGCLTNSINSTLRCTAPAPANRSRKRRCLFGLARQTRWQYNLYWQLQTNFSNMTRIKTLEQISEQHDRISDYLTAQNRYKSACKVDCIFNGIFDHILTAISITEIDDEAIRSEEHTSELQSQR